MRPWEKRFYFIIDCNTKWSLWKIKYLDIYSKILRKPRDLFWNFAEKSCSFWRSAVGRKQVLSHLLFLEFSPVFITIIFHPKGSKSHFVVVLSGPGHVTRQDVIAKQVSTCLSLHQLVSFRILSVMLTSIYGTFPSSAPLKSSALCFLKVALI